jgi:ADP-heptose:LPS heptosyltransferase
MLRRNVLIFHLGALGDFVLSWPLALALGRVFAQSRVIYVTHGQKGQLAERALRLESADVESIGWHGLFSDNAAGLSPRAMSLISGAHAIYTFVPPTPVWLANVNRINPQAKIVVIEPRPTTGFEGHISDWLLGQLREHAVERAATEQILRSIAERGIGRVNRATDSKPVVIHPGSGSPEKCWPIENYMELATRLRDGGRSVRFILGEVEQERWPADRINALAASAEVRRPQTYAELLNELAGAGIFVGNDSGPGHLAGIIGVATISIFGSASDPTRWKPLGPGVRVLQGRPIDQITVDDVCNAIVSE